MLALLGTFRILLSDNGSLSTENFPSFDCLSSLEYIGSALRGVPEPMNEGDSPTLRNATEDVPYRTQTVEVEGISKLASRCEYKHDAQASELDICEFTRLRFVLVLILKCLLGDPS